MVFELGKGDVFYEKWQMYFIRKARMTQSALKHSNLP